MQTSIRKWQMIFTGLALVIAIAAYLIFAGSRHASTGQVAEPPASFGSNNYNIMKTDTFTALISRVYGSQAGYSIHEGILEIDIKNTPLETRDFFNGNEALLPFRMNDHGFELHYNSGDKSLKALFKINEQKGVNVPNDVLLKLIEKTTTTLPHVDNQ